MKKWLKAMLQLWQQPKRINWTSILLSAVLILASTEVAGREIKQTLVPPLFNLQRLFQLPSKSKQVRMQSPHLLPVLANREDVA